jgi:ABC-2 type transport system ATP-binding protein
MVFLTTHYLAEAESADTVTMLINGRVVESGSPAEVKRRHLRPELVLDAVDRPRLRRELASIGLPPADDSGQPRVPLDGRTVQSVIRRLDSELTHLQVIEPTLEDACLRLLDRNAP